ncbi:hypothetical protein B0T16DRAFT_441660 [Cercophora newfieldiana]|uniref:Uncharacterized protein n=1 Tax=Cercophora newfieldiana TaxID=92897 RepID=A0AA39YRV6_9PEZI|nr:hypothetical protein B0T16DRAFT_441660 [Cercophora newfieldiana]
MCRITHLRGKDCRHRWAEIDEPCGPGMGFSHCPFLNDNRFTLPVPEHYTVTRRCPKCRSSKKYDKNKFRMIKSVKRGIKIGTGPGKFDLGWEIPLRCTIM